MRKLWLLLPIALSVWAQGVSTITGRVSDASGAVVPGAVIQVVNTDTNFTFSSQTNDEGIYRVPSLQPGPYRVAVEAQGFKRFVRENVELRAGDTLAVNAALELGTITEQVRVTDVTPLLQTETSSTGTVMSASTLYKLPIYQRHIPSTMNLVPGLTTEGYSFGGGLGAYNVAGQRRGTVGIFSDGAIANDQLEGTGIVRPLLNSVSEVKVLTSTLPAEYGHTAGGVIDVVNRTGTNSFHGMASVFGRSRAMQHRLYFERERASQSQEGFPDGFMSLYLLPDTNVGGPVVIPKLYDGRNKTFFFWGHQRQVEKKGAQAFGNTPTPDMKGGDFTFGGVGNPIFDPASTAQRPDGTWIRTPLPNNRVPLSQFDPVARAVLAIDPWVPPNKADRPNANGPVENLLYVENARVFNEIYHSRLDHQFNPQFKIYGSWTYNHFTGLGRPPRNIRVLEFDARDGPRTPQTNQTFSAGKTWILSPTTINDARVGYIRFWERRNVPSQGQNWPGQLGIPNVRPDLLPSFGVSGNNQAFTADSIYGLAVRGGHQRVNETLSFRNDLTKIYGTHSFKMGYEILRYRLNSSETLHPSGDFRFDNMTAGLQPNGQPVPRSGNTFAGFLLGYVRQAQFTEELAAWHPRSSIHSFYFQDDWKLSPTLTLNLGVRYSNESPFNTKYGNHTNFNPTAIDPLTGRTGALVHSGQPLAARDNNNFQPRVGVAWHPASKWVFRGGIGLYTIDIRTPQNRLQFEEYVAIDNQQRPPGDPRPMYRISQGPAPARFNVLADGTSPFVGSNFGARNATFWDPSLRNAYSLNWNATIQREVGRNYVIDWTYQGSAGVGLVERWELNTFPVDFGANDPALRAQAFRAAQNFRPFPHFGSVRQWCNCGHSTFHSGTVKLERRLADGLFFNTFYTFSKAIDSQSHNSDGSGVAPLNNRGLEKARADFDRNHRFIWTGTWELPLGRGKRWLSGGRTVNHIFGGWELAYIQTLESGNPYDLSFSNSPFNYFPTFVGDRRPNAVKPNPRLRDNWRDTGGDRFSLNNINPVLDIGFFDYPAEFTPGNLGRNVITGTPLVWSQISAQKNIRLNERFRVQLRWDMQNVWKTFSFDKPTLAVDLQNPRTFGKLRTDPRTASWGGQPLMNLTLAVYF